METLELLGISIGCLAVGGAMVLYELGRIKANVLIRFAPTGHK
jgi:hypothetical protein